MPPSRKKKPHGVKNFSLLTDDKKKLEYFKPYLPNRLPSIQVRDKEVKPGECVVMDIVGDDSGTSTSNDVCIAEVQDIRSATRDTNESFVLIRWFYTGPMLHRLPALSVKNLSSFSFAPRELVLSDHTQVFSSSQLSKKVTVRSFNESSAEQPVIGPDEWWCRYLWIPKQSRIAGQRRLESPLLTCGMTEACVKKHYRPHLEYQRYCPRDSCRIWYHLECLGKSGVKIKTESADERLQLMLRGIPGFEWIGAEDDDSKFFEHIKICFSFIQGIVACAQSSVVRGKEHGVVGTYQIVKRARMLLYEARKDDLWPSEDEIKEFVSWGLPTGPIYLCKKCNLAI